MHSHIAHCTFIKCNCFPVQRSNIKNVHTFPCHSSLSPVHTHLKFITFQYVAFWISFLISCLIAHSVVVLARARAERSRHSFGNDRKALTRTFMKWNKIMQCKHFRFQIPGDSKARLMDLCKRLSKAGFQQMENMCVYMCLCVLWWTYQHPVAYISHIQIVFILFGIEHFSAWFCLPPNSFIIRSLSRVTHTAYSVQRIIYRKMV